jgi:hypothetical protein
MSSDMILRIAAVVASVAIFFSPRLKQAAEAAWGWVQKPSEPKPADPGADLSIVLALALRLKMTGNKEGADLCQKLIDVILRSAK